VLILVIGIIVWYTISYIYISPSGKICVIKPKNSSSQFYNIFHHLLVRHDCEYIVI